MPRRAREKSDSGYYHVMLRGNERRNIFMDRDDQKKYLTLLSRQAEKGTIAVIAYCLMDNHLHLLLRENEGGLAKAMSSVGTAYVIYFNEKYYRSGHLFQNRYKSEAIEGETYLFAALRYIHQNPVKAAMCAKAEDYEWSSDRYYRNPGLRGFVDTEILLSISENREDAAVEYSRLMEIPETEKFAEIPEPPKTREEISAVVEKAMKRAGITDMKEKRSRDAIEQVAYRLHKDCGLSMRQIAEGLGISKSMVQKILSEK